MSDQPRQPRAVEMARSLGHVVEYDSTHPLSSVRRWTCTRCDCAVLDSGTAIYGSAVQGRCEATS